MDYFEALPTFSYATSSVTLNTARDIYKTILINEYTPDTYFEYVRLGDDESLTKLSLRLYGSKEFWWVLALINDIQDVIYDVPLSSNVLKEMTKETTLQTVTVTSTTGVVVGTTLSGVTSGRRVTVKDILDLSNGTWRLRVAVDRYPLNNDKQLVDYAGATIGLLSTISQTKWFEDYDTNYDNYRIANDEKRVVKVFKPQYLNDVIADINRNLNA